MRQSLRDIHTVAQNLVRISTPPSTKPSRCDVPVAPLTPPLVLHLPSDLHLLLESTGTRVTESLKEAAGRLRNVCMAIFEESCQRVMAMDAHPSASSPSHLQENLRTAFQARYEKQVRSWVNNYITKRARGNGKQVRSSFVTSRFADQGSPTSTGQKVPFNKDYTPVLEHFFQNKPYPSPSDKMMLAKKTGMQYKQIHIWFQNHRRRARKTSTIPRKKHGQDHSKRPLDVLATWSLERLISEKDQAGVEDPVDSDSWESSSDEDGLSHPILNDEREIRPLDVLDIPAAPYAFPSPYLAPQGVDPFSKGEVYRFPPLIWKHTTVFKAPTRAVAFSDLLTTFERKLSLMPSTKKRISTLAALGKQGNAKSAHPLVSKSVDKHTMSLRPTKPNLDYHSASTPTNGTSFSYNRWQRARLPNISRLRTSLTSKRSPRRPASLPLLTRSNADTSSTKDKKMDRRIAPLPRRIVPRPFISGRSSASTISQQTSSESCQYDPKPTNHSQRKVAPLPKRVPPSAVRCSFSPSSSDLSLSPSETSSLRSRASFNNSFSPNSRVSSSSTLSWSAPSTPESPHQALPESIQIVLPGSSPDFDQLFSSNEASPCMRDVLGDEFSALAGDKLCCSQFPSSTTPSSLASNTSKIAKVFS